MKRFMLFFLLVAPACVQKNTGAGVCSVGPPPSFSEDEFPSCTVSEEKGKVSLTCDQRDFENFNIKLNVVSRWMEKIWARCQVDAGR